MSLHQISLFLENKPGRLAAICHTLTDNGVNIGSLSLADTSEFGIVRLLVDNWEKARDVLKAAGVGVNVREVVAVDAADEPGALARTLDAAVAVVRRGTTDEDADVFDGNLAIVPRKPDTLVARITCLGRDLDPIVVKKRGEETLLAR